MRVPRTSKTRPTSDKVREAMFNVLGVAVVNAAVLDLYAGSGALAIEALSRGAVRAVLVESDRQACAAIRSNLERVGFDSSARLHHLPVERALAEVDGPFDLVVADPPYDMPGIEEIIRGLDRQGLVAPGGIVVLEHGKRFPARAEYGKLIRWQQKRYGDTVLSFYESVDPVKS